WKPRKGGMESLVPSHQPTQRGLEARFTRRVRLGWLQALGPRFLALHQLALGNCRFRRGHSQPCRMILMVLGLFCSGGDYRLDFGLKRNCFGEECSDV